MISEAVREEREYCCDDLAAFAAGDERKMAVALTTLGLVRKGLALGLAVTPPRRSFYRRVTRLIEPQRHPAVSVRGGILGLLGAAVVVVLLAQCSRSAAVQDKLPVDGDRLEQVLTDNQAGYKEQVFNYTRGGKEHELFLVRTQDEKQTLYGYVDGKRLSQDELPAVMNVVKAQRRQWSRDREVFSALRSGIPANTRVNVKRDDVKVAMATYAKDTPMISLGVAQHRILTRIITSNQYTEKDQREVSELVRARQALMKREHDAVLFDGWP